MTYFNTATSRDDVERQDRYADRAIAEVLEPRPTDRDRVEGGLRRCYELAGWEWHDNVVWVASPVALLFTVMRLGASRFGIDYVIDAPRELADSIDAAVDRTELRSRQPPLRRSDWQDAVRAQLDAPLPTPEDAERGESYRRAGDALGLRQPKVKLHTAGRVPADWISENPITAHLEDRVANEAQVPLRAAELRSLHSVALPAKRNALWRCSDIDASALCLAESAIEMNSHVQRARVGYLITEQGAHDKHRTIHDAVSALESAGWTWAHRDVCIVAERHTMIQVCRAGDIVVVASDDGPCLAWADGTTSQLSVADAVAMVS